MLKTAWVRTTLGVVTIAALAFGLRLYRFELPQTSALDALRAGTLPPGLHWDEAYNTLAALRLVREGGFEPFIRIDLGRMPLHIYLTTLLFTLFGPFTVGGRIAALIPGLLNLVVLVPLVQTAFAEVLSGSERNRLTWLAAGQMAVTYWFVHFSRLGMEHSSLAFYSTLALWGMWWAVRQPTPWRTAIAGGLLGLSIYSYPAAYALPVAALMCLAYAVFRQHPPRALIWRFALRYALGCALVVLPLMLFAGRYPEWILNRPTALGVTSLTQLGQNIFNTVGGLIWRGDYNTSYNLRDRPFFDPIQVGLFLLGLGVCGRRIRQPAYAFGPIWLGVMLLPQIFSEAPHFGRIAGATVPAVLIAALGGLTLWQWLQAHSRWRVMSEIGLYGLILASGVWTARDYFGRWPLTPDFYQTFRVAERLEAELAREQPDDVIAYLSPTGWEVPTLQYILGDHTNPQVRPFNGRECSVLPPAGQSARYWLTAYEDRQTPERLAMLYAPTLTEQVYAVGELGLVRQMGVSANIEPSLPAGHWPVPAYRLGNVMQPLAVLLAPDALQPGATELPVTLIWEVLGPSVDDLVLGLYLLGPNAQLITQLDRQPCAGSYPTSRWNPGEWMVEERRLALPPDLSPGPYTLALALYHYPSLGRLPVTNMDGAPVGDLAALLTLTLPGP